MSATSSNDRSRRPPPLGVRFGRWIAGLELSPSEHHVALAMVIYADGDGTGIRPGVATIARDTGLSESTVIRAIHGSELRGGGLLRAGVLVQVDPGGGRRRPAEYRVNPRMVTEYSVLNPRMVRGNQAGTLSRRAGNPVTEGPKPSHSDTRRGKEEEEEERARASATEPLAARSDDEAARRAQAREELLRLLEDPDTADVARNVAERQLAKLDARTDGDSVPARLRHSHGSHGSPRQNDATPRPSQDSQELAP